jgi:hypothetical protein
MSLEITHTDGFSEDWQARVLTGPPMIAPVRQFVFPQAVPGEEDALARGAMWIEIKPLTGGAFLAQCALGFAGKGVASGIWSTPDPTQLLAIAGGYGYRIDTKDPDRTELLPVRPVVSVHPAPQADAIVLIGFHTAYVLTAGEPWQSPKLSWEGVAVTGIEGDVLHGTGWHMPSDKELPFTLHLRTRELTGGGCQT